MGSRDAEVLPITWRTELKCNWGSNYIVINDDCVCDFDRSLSDANALCIIMHR